MFFETPRPADRQAHCQTEFFHSYCSIVILSGVYLSELDILTYAVLQSIIYLLDAGGTLSSVLYNFLFLHVTHNNIILYTL